MTQERENNSPLISWTAQEFIKKDKEKVWFFVFGIIALALFIIGILIKNYIFSIIIFLSSFLIFIQALRHPQKIKTEIYEDHITINDFLEIIFKEIRSFWIFEEADFNSLCFEMKKFYRPKIYLPLGQQSPDKIREILIKFINEEKQEESLIDIIARRINF
jgi:hypothetical protein